MKNNINELKSYERQLKDYILTIELSMDTLDKETNKLYTNYKKELKYIKRLIKSQLTNQVF